MAPKLGFLAGLLLLSCHASVARVADACTVDVNGSKGTIACTGDVPEQAPGGEAWPAALASLQNASTVALRFERVEFTAAALQRALTLVVGAGESAAVGSVSVDFEGCTMQGVEADLAAVAPLAGSTQYVINLSSCTIKDNAINATAFLAGESNLDVSLRLLGSDVSGNNLTAAGAVAVGATGKAAITLAEGSVVSDNTAVLLGALAVGGDGELSVQLASANVTDNSVELIGLVATGGNATLAVDGASGAGVTVAGNTAETASLMVVQGQPLVATAMDVVTGLGFATEGFDLSSALNRAQGEVCSAVAGLNLTAAAAELPAELVQAVAPAALKIVGLLCDGDKPATNFTLGSLSGSLSELLGAGANSSGIVAALESVVEGLLGPEAEQALEAVVSGLLANGTADPAALDDLLAAVLTSPAGDAAAGAISDLLGKLADWLETPLGGAGDGGDGGDGGEPGGEDPSGLDLGGVIGQIVDAVGGNTSSPAGQAATDVINTIEDLLAGLTDGSESVGDAVNSIVQALTGGKDSPLAGTDITGLIPILQAVISDPAARGQLPALLQGVASGNGGIGGANLGPILSAILGNPDASAALPSLLGLLGNLGLQLPGTSG